jgi:hypothetical protein
MKNLVLFLAYVRYSVSLNHFIINLYRGSCQHDQVSIFSKNGVFEVYLYVHSPVDVYLDGDNPEYIYSWTTKIVGFVTKWGKYYDYKIRYPYHD